MKQLNKDEFYKCQLSNGIQVVAARIPYLRSISIGFWIKAGSRNEPADLNGIFHFLEHLAFKGTERRSARQIAIEMDSIGGQIDAFTSREYTCYTAKILDEHLPIALDVLSDILLHSVFDPDEIERERQVILEEISMVEDCHSDYIFDMLYKNMWPGHALGSPIQGVPETVKKISRKNILSYIKQFHSSNNMLISFAGNIDFPTTINLLEKHFASLRNSKQICCAPVDEITSGFVSKYRKLEQVHLCLATRGLKIKDQRRYECYLLNLILGGSMSSRLFQKIREEKGLAYSIHSAISQYKDTGTFGIYAATGKKNYTIIIELILQEIKDIKNSKIDKKELEKAKNQLKGLLMLSLESSESRMVQLAREEMYFGKHFTHDEIIGKINGVTAGGIKSLANKLFNSEFYNLAILGPIKKNKTLESMLHD